MPVDSLFRDLSYANELWYVEPEAQRDRYIKDGHSKKNVPVYPANLPVFTHDGGYAMLYYSEGDNIQKSCDSIFGLIEMDCVAGIGVNIIRKFNLEALEILPTSTILPIGFHWIYIYPWANCDITDDGELPIDFWEQDNLASDHMFTFLRLFPEYVRIMREDGLLPYMFVPGCRLKNHALYLLPKSNNRLEVEICRAEACTCKKWSFPTFKPFSTIV